MVESPVAAVAGPGAVEEAILRRVSDRADQWFPGVGEAPAVRLHRVAERPRALLYTVYVGDEPAPRVLAKVRRDAGAGSDGPRNGMRPRLTSDFLSASEQTVLEYRGLTAIQTMVDAAPDAFTAVRPLDHLAAENAILMEYVPDAMTLRDLIARNGRLSPRWGRTGRVAHELWEQPGAWLRLFQQRMPQEGLPTRQWHRDDVVALFDAYGTFLERGLGTRATGGAGRHGAELAAAVLPERLPLAVGHGDYAPRNVFLLGDGRLAVFDPMPRWLVPRFEDLCRFLVNLRFQGASLHTHGWSQGVQELARREHSLIEGYCGDEQLSMPQLRCYQLLITLDKWSTLLDTAHGPARLSQRMRKASVVLASGHLRREARRLLALAATEPGS